MSERRRYTKRQKATAVIAAEMSSVAAAAEQSGIPRKTLAYWLDAPEFAALRQKTREQMAEGMATIVHLAQARIVAEIEAGRFEPRDLVTLLGVATDKGQLLAGQATARTETVTASLSDHERDQLKAVIQRALAETPAP
jgi:transposase-like protein